MRELYLCLDLDVTGEGQKAARKLAREAVLHGIPVHMMEDGAYGGCSEPSDQWEAEGRVTLDGAELELCQECKAPSIITTRTAPRIAKPTAWRCVNCDANLSHVMNVMIP